jgi:DNA-binding response OmpR family regulator
MVKVLVAEDDAPMLAGLVEVLEGEGYIALPARDGAAALELFEAESPDFVLLDIMMPEVNGYDVCRAIRALGSRVPIVFLSAKSEEIDKVLGLELGADDFVMKPFGVRELVARLRAISRRCFADRRDATTSDFELAGLTVVPAELRVRRPDGETIELSLREVRILELFHRNRGVVLDRDTLFRECWGGSHYPNSRTLDQHISKLRKKVESDSRSPSIIHTVRGVGYRYDG